jgi:hypothetical protein
MNRGKACAANSKRILRFGGYRRELDVVFIGD